MSLLRGGSEGAEKPGVCPLSAVPAEGCSGRFLFVPVDVAAINRNPPGAGGGLDATTPENTMEGNGRARHRHRQIPCETAKAPDGGASSLVCCVPATMTGGTGPWTARLGAWCCWALEPLNSVLCGASGPGARGPLWGRAWAVWTELGAIPPAAAVRGRARWKQGLPVAGHFVLFPLRLPFPG